MHCRVIINKTWFAVLLALFLILCIGSLSRKSTTNWREYLPSRPSFVTVLESDAAANDNNFALQKPSGSLSYPEEYLFQTKYDEWCETLFGPQYLDRIAVNHFPYCKPESLDGKLECFQTDHTEEEMCIARGVSFDMALPYFNKMMGFHCDLRNFTLEKSQSARKQEDLKYVKDVENFGTYFYDTGPGPQLWEWHITPSHTSSQEQCDATQNDGKHYLLIRREGNRNVWYKLMELWQAKVTLDVLQMAIDPETGAPFVPAAKVKDIEIVFEDEEPIGTMSELWPMITGKEPIRLSSIPATCMGTVILPLAGSTSPFWESVWAPQDCKNTFLVDPFLRLIYKHLGIEPKKRLVEETVFTVIDRKNRRRIYDLENKVERLKLRYPNITFRLVDLAKLSLREQIDTMQGTDVLFGTIGAGMTHIFFLPPESSVGEIMPSGIAYAGFRNLAKMRGLQYYTAHAETQEEWAMHHEIPPEVINDDKEILETGDWQTDKWIFMTDEAFQSLADAAINGQLNRGMLVADVTPKGVMPNLSF